MTTTEFRLSGRKLGTGAQNVLNLIKSLSRSQKRVIMIAMDSLLLPLAFLLSLNLQMPAPLAWSELMSFLPVMPYLLIISAGLSLWMGICSVQLNAYESNSIGLTAVFAGLTAIASYLLSLSMGLGHSPALHVVFGTSFFVFSAISRAILLQVVIAIYSGGTDRCRVLIYGAGTTGMQLVSALRSHAQIDPIAFVDDNTALQGMNVARLPVFSPVRIPEIVRERNIDRVLLAMPSQTQPKQAQIARRLQKMGLEVQTLPSFAQLIGEEALVDKLQPLNPSRFLNRTEVADALGKGAAVYKGRKVMITGAGGSIGSEICRQILDCAPESVVLFELSELALYQIHQELEQLAEGSGIKIVPILGSVTDARHVRKILARYEIQVVLHAAAYKHVPLVEDNPLAGLANNVLGTQTLASESTRHGVERFLLISSDKAVRPANVMGASKRLAELVVQDMASRIPTGEGPIFTMVRFGNVLGSSGSVVPLFQDQVRRGGPVTVTHPDVSRFFMTVQEAVNLVLCAGAMAEGGELYVLDMGKPVSIEQLARQIIESAGYTVRDTLNPDGDIEIAFTGLRPGEKLTEELCASGALVGTPNRKIFSAQETHLSEIEVAAFLRALREALASGDETAACNVALRWVEGFAGRRERLEDEPSATDRLTPVT